MLIRERKVLQYVQDSKIYIYPTNFIPHCIINVKHEIFWNLCGNIMESLGLVMKARGLKDESHKRLYDRIMYYANYLREPALLSIIIFRNKKY